MLMSSDEDDYMSDKLLNNCVTDIRPGLINNYHSLRQNEVQAKKARHDEENRKKLKPIKLLEEERRNEGLEKSISPDNKGFAMLTKMGYKKGEHIGKIKRIDTAGIEPIRIHIKIDRGGFGREAALAHLKKTLSQIKKRKLIHRKIDSLISIEEYRTRCKKIAEQKQIESDLGKCQGACEKLDHQASIRNPYIVWFWPKRISTVKNNNDKNSNFLEISQKTCKGELNNDEDSEDSNDEHEFQYESAEKLEMVTNYLRTVYYFCYWCGTKYYNQDDMTKNCPGQFKDDH